MAETATISFPALGSSAVLSVTDRDALGPAREVLEQELAAIDRSCSRFRPDSELVRLNAAGGETVRISKLLCEAIAAALQAARQTSGLVDPTVGRALRLAGYDRDFSLVRLRESCRTPSVLGRLSSWQEVELDPVRGTARVPPGTELDLGATAKALAADRAARSASAATGAGVLVALGGDVSVAGRAPRGGWPIRIADNHAADPSSPGPAVAISSGGLASSGTAVRRWKTSRGEGHHIIDPRDGRPARTPWRTVSVAAASCLDANVAGTAAVVLGEQAPAWLAARRLPALLCGEHGEVVCVAGWPEAA